MTSLSVNITINKEARRIDMETWSLLIEGADGQYRQFTSGHASAQRALSYAATELDNLTIKPSLFALLVDPPKPEVDASVDAELVWRRALRDTGGIIPDDIPLNNIV